MQLSISLKRFQSYAKHENLELYRNRKSDGGPVDYNTERKIAEERFPGRIGDIPDNVKEDGLFYYKGKPANGRFMWSIAEDGEFSFNSQDHPGLSSIVHPHLARGNKVYGAGEFDVIDGKYEVNDYLLPKTGHYFDIYNPNFDKNVINAFKERARGLGWKSVNDKSLDNILIDNTGKLFAREGNIPIRFEEVNRNRYSLDDLLKLESGDIRNRQQVLADRSRQIDLPNNEIARIRTGDFTESEIARIQDTRRILRENGFDNELELLDNPRRQRELLLSHYSGNIPINNFFNQLKVLS